MDFSTGNEVAMTTENLGAQQDLGFAATLERDEDAKPAMTMDKSSAQADAGSAGLVEAMTAGALAAVAAANKDADSKAIHERRFAIVTDASRDALLRSVRLNAEHGLFAPGCLTPGRMGASGLRHSRRPDREVCDRAFCGLQPAAAGRALVRSAVENVAHLRRQIAEAERLDDQLHALVEPSVVDDGVARVSGRKEHL